MAGLIALLTGLAVLTIVSMLHLLGDNGHAASAINGHVDQLVALRSSLAVMHHEAENAAADAERPALVAAIEEARDRLDVLRTQPSRPPVPVGLLDALRGHLDLLRRELTTGALPSGEMTRHEAALDALAVRLDDAIATEPLRDVRHAKALTNATVARVVIVWLVGATAALVVGRHLTKAVSPRLTALAEVARRFADGDLEARLSPGPADEVGRVVTTFNDMADRLNAAKTELERKGADIDELTGLANRAVFWRALDAAVDTARSTDLVCSMSTWTASNRSTTGSATTPGTEYWLLSELVFVPPCEQATLLPVSAVMSSGSSRSASQMPSLTRSYSACGPRWPAPWPSTAR